MNCFRYLDYKSFEEVDRMTLAEYKLLMQAVRLKQVDTDYRNHLQAYLNFVVKAEKKSGKYKSQPVYKRFKQFFDYEKAVEKVTEKETKSRFDGLGKLLFKGE